MGDIGTRCLGENGVLVLKELAHQFIALLYGVKMGIPLPPADVRVSPFVEEVLFRTPNHVQN